MFYCFQVFWAIGGMLEVVLAILVLEPFGWRWWLVASALPTALFLVFCYVSILSEESILAFLFHSRWVHITTFFVIFSVFTRISAVWSYNWKSRESSGNFHQSCQNEWNLSSSRETFTGEKGKYFLLPDDNRGRKNY